MPMSANPAKTQTIVNTCVTCAYAMPRMNKPTPLTMPAMGARVSRVAIRTLAGDKTLRAWLTGTDVISARGMEVAGIAAAGDPTEAGLATVAEGSSDGSGTSSL